MNKFLLIIFSPLIINFALFAQNNPNTFITGNVIEEESKSPLEFVNVALFSLPDSLLITGTITDNRGKFQLSTIKKGTFYISIDFIGYKKEIYNSIEINGSSATLELGTIILSHELIGINEVEVTADRSLISYHLDKKVITVGKNISAQSGTAVDVLQQAPSVQTDLEGNLTIRGSSSFTVLVDGRQSPLNGSDALNQIPASTIDRIEIITNPSVKYNPDGTVGIINVITKKGIKNSKSLIVNSSVGIGPIYSGDITASVDYKKISVQVGANFRHNEFSGVRSTNRENYDDSSLVSTNSRGIRMMQNFTVKTNIDYRITTKNTLSGGISRSDFRMENSEDSKNSSLKLDTTAYYLSRDAFEVNPVSWNFNIGDRMVFNNPEHTIITNLSYQVIDNKEQDLLYKYYSGIDWYPDSLSQPISRTENRENRYNIIFNADYSLPVGTKSKIEAGYGMRLEESNEQFGRDTSITANSNWLADGSFSAVSNYSQNIQSIYVLGTTKLASFDMNLGLRYEYTNRLITVAEQNKEYAFKANNYYPSFAISREWAKGHKLIASYSSRVNRPRDWFLSPFVTPSDGFNLRKGNPELEPEYIYATELNYQKTIQETTLSAELFYRYTDNAITRRTMVDSNDVNIMTIANLGKEESMGLDLTGDIKIAKWWTLSPVLSVYYYKLTDNKNGITALKDDFSFNTGMSTFIILATKTRVQLNFNYEGPEITADGTSDAIWYTGLAIQQSFFNRKLSATFRMDDIFNTRRRSFTNYGENYYSTNKFYRDNRFISLTLSYKINPQKAPRKKEGENFNNGNDEMDIGM